MIDTVYRTAAHNTVHKNMDGRSRSHCLIEGRQGDIASASLVGQEAARIEIANTVETGGLVSG